MRKAFTQGEIETLLRNEHVVRCTENSITYSSLFKVQAVNEYEEGKSSREIFIKAGFDLDIIGKKKPKSLLRAWNSIYREKGISGLQKDGRGSSGGSGRPRTKNLTDKEKLKKLEAEVAYLKAENDFLAKLRAKQRE